MICKKAPCTAVNTQENTGNHGFNAVSKYSRPDFICISENELRLDARNKSGNLHELTRNLPNQLNCENIVVTRSLLGCLCYNRDNGFITAPALTNNFKDRAGAGEFTNSDYLGSIKKIEDIIPQEKSGYHIVKECDIKSNINRLNGIGFLAPGMDTTLLLDSVENLETLLPEN